MSLTKELQELTDGAIARKKREQHERERIQNAIFAEKDRIINNFVVSERMMYWEKLLHDKLIEAASNGESNLNIKFEINDFTIPGIITTYAIVHIGNPFDVFRIWFNRLTNLKGTKYDVSNRDKFEFNFDWSVKQKHY